MQLSVIFSTYNSPEWMLKTLLLPKALKKHRIKMVVLLITVFLPSIMPSFEDFKL